MVDESSLLLPFSVDENLFSIFCNCSIRGANGVNECSEAECRMKLFEQNNEENLASKEVFSLNVHLTDHTGTIINVKLGDDAARKLLKCSVRESISSTLDCHSRSRKGRRIPSDDRWTEDQTEMDVSLRETAIWRSGTWIRLSLFLVHPCLFVLRSKPTPPT